MNILFLGDVVGNAGTDTVFSRLKEIKREYNIDITIANGENSANGNGILPYSANRLFDASVNVITSGNHVFRRREIYEMLDSDQAIIRPANFSKENPGKGTYVLDLLKRKVAVVNLMGTTNLEPLKNPFSTMDEILDNLDADIIILDFHAEATSEKRAMGFYLDGKVTAVIGTHTHVQTNDAQILPKGTAYITDAGMCGPYYSVLGVDPDKVIERFKTAMPTRFFNPEGKVEIDGVVLNIDDKTNKATSISHFVKIFD